MTTALYESASERCERLLRINFTTLGMDRTGGNRVIFEVGTRLAAKGHDVTFTALTPYDRQGRWFPLPRCKVIYAEMGAKLPGLSITAPGVVSQLLRKIHSPWDIDRLKVLADAIPECDINVATYNPTVFAVHRSGNGVPFYYVQHHEPLFYEDEYSRRMAEETYYLPLKCITVSSWLRDLLLKQYGKNSYLCLNGVNRTVFYPKTIRRQDNKTRVLSIGRKLIWKGLDDLLRAMTLVYAERQDVELLLVTQDELSIPRTTFPVRLLRANTDQELSEIYSACDVYVNASWYEGFGLPNLEAMACGVPVVTTSRGVEDYVLHEYNALVTSPRQPKQMAHEIIRILDNQHLRERLIENGLKTADVLTWEKTTESVEAAFMGSLTDQGEPQVT